MNVMAKEPAYIANSFLKLTVAGVLVASCLEEQRVPTPFTEVLVVAGASGNRDVVMLAEKTGQRVGDV
jgi:hypothetical protein